MVEWQFFASGWMIKHQGVEDEEISIHDIENSLAIMINRLKPTSLQECLIKFSAIALANCSKKPLTPVIDHLIQI